MSNSVWAPVDLSAWSSVPAVTGRIATEEDVRQGAAVFFDRTGESSVYGEVDLPALAIYTNSGDGSQEQVVVIQLETKDNKVLAGVRPLEGGSLICTIEQLNFVSESDLRAADPGN